MNHLDKYNKKLQMSALSNCNDKKETPILDMIYIVVFVMISMLTVYVWVKFLEWFVCAV